jgi:AraC-like DNA-binding protein
MPIVLGLQEIAHTPYASSSFTPPQHLHSHGFFEISFCSKGHAINTINGVPFPFQNGGCVILRPGDVHSLTEYDSKVYEHIDLYATTETFKKICDAAHENLFEEIVNAETPICFNFSNEIFSFLFNQFLLLKEMIGNNDSFFQTLHASMISVILSEWIKNKVYVKKFMPNWLNELLPKFNNISFLQKNITQIAQEAGFSLPYFSTQFKKHVGVSAIEYLTKKRVHLSKDLLAKDERLRILDISGMLGFENPSTFSKHFMQEFKLTPKEYRKQTKRQKS